MFTNFDKDRMIGALSSESYEMPEGLSREQQREFIIDKAMQGKIEEIRSGIMAIAYSTLAANQECFIAQWIIQNPEEKIADWEMCYGPDYNNPKDLMVFFMRRRV